MTSPLPTLDVEYVELLSVDKVVCEDCQGPVELLHRIVGKNSAVVWVLSDVHHIILTHNQVAYCLPWFRNGVGDTITLKVRTTPPGLVHVRITLLYLQKRIATENVFVSVVSSEVIRIDNHLRWYS